MKLNRLDNFVQRRRCIANKYNEAFSFIDSIKIPKTNTSIEHAYHLYTLQIDFKKLTFTKKYIFEKLKTMGINLQVHYIPVHLQPFYKNKYGFKPSDFPKAENFYEKTVSIPIYPSLTDDEVKKVEKDISSFFES